MRISDWSSDVCSSDLVIHVVAEELIDLTRRLRDLQPEFTRADHVKHQGRDQRDPKPSTSRHPRDVNPMPTSRDFHWVKRERPLSLAGPRRSEAQTSGLSLLMPPSYSAYCLCTNIINLKHRPNPPRTT